MGRLGKIVSEIIMRFAKTKSGYINLDHVIWIESDGDGNNLLRNVNGNLLSVSDETYKALVTAIEKDIEEDKRARAKYDYYKLIKGIR